MAQMQLSDYQLNNKELRIENATLSAAIPKKVKKAKMKAVPAEFLAESTVIEDVARMFTMMATPWTVKGDFTVPRPVDLDPFKPERYATKASAKLAVAAELFHYVPPKLHDMMENTDFFFTAVSTPLV